jgi:predicted P-loop ATPase
MPDMLTADPKRAVEFVAWLTCGAPLHLERMNSTGQESPVHRTYAASDRNSAESFVAMNNSADLRRNLYFLPNAEFLGGKRGKANLSAVRFLHADLDGKDYPGTPAEQLDTILGLLVDATKRPKAIPPTSAVCFTGGGYQAFWRLAEPIGVDEAEQINRAILAALQGEGNTHSPAQLMRLPWTVNWLNAKKRQDGREPALAYVAEPVKLAAPPLEYRTDDFKFRQTKGQAPALLPSRGKLPDMAELQPLPLPDDLSEILPLDPDWAAVIVDGVDPPGRVYKSRSELVFAATIWMLANDVQPGHALSVITNPALKIAAHVLENPNPLKYARRQIERAFACIETKRGGWPAVDDNGRPKTNVPENIRFALTVLDIEARRNLFIQADEIAGFDLDGRDIGEIGEILCSTFARKLEFGASVATIKRELIAIAHEQSYHPVLDYLEGVAWDGTPRIDNWLRDYCGAQDSPLNREFGAKFLIAAVRRIRQPGVKFDSMLVLEGEQGSGKSSLAARLAVREKWYCGSLDLNADAKTKAEMLARAWIVECQELDGARKATLDAVKKFLSTPVDTYRRSYAHNAGHYPRHCVIIGTTNEDAYLRDLTGNRRFWPVRVGRIEIRRFSEDIHQLWAEAVQREAAGEPITLSPELWKAAAALQQGRMVEDPFADVLEGAFADRTGRVSMESVKLLLNLDSGRMYAGEAQRLRACMAALGWEYGTHRLRDLAGSRRTQRKGFAKAGTEERQTEWIARRDKDGTIALDEAASGTGDESPF